jgi:hypothetical protein
MRRHFPASGETQQRQPNRWLKPLMAVPFLTAAFVMFAWPDPYGEASGRRGPVRARMAVRQLGGCC